MGKEDDDPKYDQIVYDDVISNIIHNYVTGLRSVEFNGSDGYQSEYYFAKDYHDKSQFISNLNKSVSITLQLPHWGGFIICLSKKVSYQENMDQVYDKIYFNASALSKKNFYMNVHVHQVGQVMIARGTHLLEIKTNNLSKMKREYEYNINKVEVLRKRHDSKARCDENLSDETGMFLNTGMREVGCIPAYWQIFADKPLHRLPKCNQSQYRTIYQNYINGLSTVRAMYTQPCSSMTLSTTYSPGSGNFEVKSSFKVCFVYDQEYYKEILNKRAYTSGDLLAQVGGYVGNR